jgi:hypothetical protein
MATLTVIFLSLPSHMPRPDLNLGHDHFITHQRHLTCGLPVHVMQPTATFVNYIYLHTIKLHSNIGSSVYCLLWLYCMWPTNLPKVMVVILWGTARKSNKKKKKTERRSQTPLFNTLSSHVVSHRIECQIPELWHDVQSMIGVYCNLQVKRLDEL